MNILITGGGMENKGAQSMTFIMVEELRKRYPEDNILLMIPDDCGLVESGIYNFSTYTARIKSLFYINGGASKALAKIKKVDKIDAQKLEDIFSESRMLVDISGYALSSVWSTYVVRFYLMMIKCANKFNVPVYIMPQSFGPFDYKFPKVLYMNKIIKKTMAYPEVIYAREQEGYDFLTKKYNLKNVKLSYDMVLINQKIDLNNIYLKLPNKCDFNIKNNSVAIIPNARNFDYGNEAEIMQLYKSIIIFLLESEKNVYVLYHSSEDSKICKKLKELFADDARVNLIEKDLNCFEYEQIADNFDFVIASRYHSIIHSYRNRVPCVAIGWATKYYDLLSAFNQNEYVFDVREKVETDKILSKIKKMMQNREEESIKIESELKEIRKENIFDILNK